MHDAPPYQGPGTQSWSAPGAWWAAVFGSWICRCQGKSGGSCTGQLEKLWPQRAGQTRVCERKYATPEATEVLVTGIKIWNSGRQSPRRWPRTTLYVQLLYKVYAICPPHWNGNNLSKMFIWFSATSLKFFMGSITFRFKKNQRPFPRSLAGHSRSFLNCYWSSILALFPVGMRGALITLAHRTYKLPQVHHAISYLHEAPSAGMAVLLELSSS